MRSARLILLAAAAVLSLAITAAASGMRPGPVEDGTLSVRDGRATIQLRLKGGVIGRFGRGKLTVVDALGGTSRVVVLGVYTTRSPNERTTVYTGRNIRFRIADDKKFVVRINASKINFSAVGRGDGWLDGWGNPDKGIYFDGSFSLNGDAYKSIPDERDPFQLSALPSDG
jgi:hypothetical protein